MRIKENPALTNRYLEGGLRLSRLPWDFAQHHSTTQLRALDSAVTKAEETEAALRLWDMLLSKRGRC